MPKAPTRQDINNARLRPSLNPIWKGPEKQGISQSMINSYLVCKERFRIKSIDGLEAKREFSAPITMGSMWHICEENFAKHTDWTTPLKEYAQRLCSRNKTDQDEIVKWYNVVRVTFPIYITYWKDHDDVKKRTPLLQEEKVSVPYSLPSGRVVKLRGMIDAADYIGKKVYIQENKTKSEVDDQKLKRQLTFDLQTMTYSVMLSHHAGVTVSGVRYNVIRRPLSGGKGSIRKHKGTKNRPEETWEHYWQRLGEVIKENEDTYFYRWKADFHSSDLPRFERHFLQPLLENICDDYEWWTWCQSNRSTSPFDYMKRASQFPKHQNRHYRFPYGTYNVLARGGFHELDEYLNIGSMVGLKRTHTMFPELEE